MFIIAPLTSSPTRADRLWAQRRESRRSRPPTSICTFSFSESAHLVHRVMSRWVDRDAALQAQAAPTLSESAPSSTAKLHAVHHPTTTSSYHRDHGACFFFSVRGMLNPRPEDVDFYICEYFGQMLVTVGEFTPCFEKQPCFPSRDLIVQRPISRTAQMLFTKRDPILSPSLE